MKHLTRLLIVALISLTVFSCDKDDDSNSPAKPNLSQDTEGNYILEGTITSDLTLDSDYKYVLKGFVHVEAPAVLTIEAGTIIKGYNSTADGKSTLIIKPGAKILAEGTSTKPIVFTSKQPKGARKAGDWGGVIILGNGIVNKGVSTIEGEGISTFGGTNDADNSGKFKYVRIEFPGIAFETDKEINGLTLGGVGSGTEIDYVQVSYSGDDSYEWFGGAVNAKHLVAFAGVDDDFDTDNGYKGKVQYAFALRDPGIADQAGASNVFESDNDGTGSAAAPVTSAVFSNVSVYVAPGAVNGKYGSALHLRRNTQLSIFNSVFVGGYKNGLLLDASSTLANAKAGLLELQNIVFSGATTSLKEAGADVTLTDVETYFNTTSRANSVIATGELKLDASYNTLAAPKVLPQTGSPLLTGGLFTNAKVSDNFFDKTATFKGAFGTSDWTTGWTNFDPQNTDY